jgi:copper chaperone CopZ
MELTFTIDGMSCQHCVRRVTTALGKVPDIRVEEVTVGRARVEALDDAAAGAVVAALERAGYPARVEAAPGDRP